MILKTRLLYIIFTALITLYLYRILNDHNSKIRELASVTTPTQITNASIQITSLQPTLTITKSPQPSQTTPPSSEPPARITIEIPFTSQAPLAHWDTLHEDACEEASLIMVLHFLVGTKIETKENVEDEIQQMVSWETKNGYEPSISLLDLSRVAKQYGKTTFRIENAIKSNIINELADNKPVIVPVAGRELNNPNFKQPGPIYHMLVIKGYDKNGFITND